VLPFAARRAGKANAGPRLLFSFHARGRGAGKTMLEAIRAFFGKQVKPEAAEAETGAGNERIQLAACALLLELAHADDEFAPEERKHIEGAMIRHFDLSDEAAKELIALAERERANSVDLFQFANLIAEEYDEAQKMVLAEVMWGLVHSDGKLSGHEDYLMTKFSRLLDLRPGYLAEAKKRALGR
jgi:uncharacterized tellurite resistance protein B-like protein